MISDNYFIKISQSNKERIINKIVTLQSYPIIFKKIFDILNTQHLFTYTFDLSTAIMYIYQEIESQELSLLNFLSTGSIINITYDCIELYKLTLIKIENSIPISLLDNSEDDTTI